jgi:hypothetical protein
MILAFLYANIFSTTKPEPLVAAEHRQIRNENEDFLSRNEGPRRLQISKGSESPFSPRYAVRL